MNRIRALLLSLFSECDNATPDVVRVVGGLLAFVGGIEFLWLSAWDVIVNKQPFAHEHFGAGLSLVIAALGAAVAAKALTEKH
ncbi:hypothetical protein CS053_08350 [Rhodanobacter glycinis]|uniref:Uncharacterized protein n=1 Tax=Rhodanobacter glycinis TaxID=582702 RepID=A0A5B9E1G9_9GAMM|nr:hypothetical protein [Rhodanobacter glycinis]QEE24511.1 hypothetical protein CS053_08350 [Rhodanobacter glycinis]